ncbi:glycosyltransferase [Paenibacillus glucanolyticus]|uniref:glycosyltransferase n=1 Tax=Paenibacillus glucanolyticus TaxID=59843 RepID=UPI0034CFC306
MKRKEDKWYFTFINNNVDFNSRIYEERYWFHQDLEEFLQEKKINIIHFTSPFMFDIEIPEINNKTMKISYLVYDLIPMVMKEDYFAKWPSHIQAIYINRSQKIKEADLILTISESSKQDIIEYLGVDSKKIIVIYASTNEDLYHPKATFKQRDLLEKELKIEGPFIYSLTGFDPRKNNKGLIDAFAKISQKDNNIKLIIGGIKQSQEKSELLEYARKRSLDESNLIILGFVSEDVLVALYQECRLFVFPSLYEGFGLPVLEAMRSGAPVITSNCSSLPEIVGDTAELVDPRNEYELELAIKKLLSDETLRKKYISEGIVRSQKFSWRAVTEKSYKSFEDLSHINKPKLDPYSKPKLAYFSPLNPQKSGISDYSEELLLKLREYYDIAIITKQFEPDNKFILDTFEIIDINKQEDVLEQFDNRLYHIGNNEYHEWIVDTLERYPGHIVLHDFNLFGYFIYTLYLKGRTKEFMYELVYNSGLEGEAASNSLMESNIIPEAQQFPLSNRIVDLSKGVIVHSNWVKNSILINNNYSGPVSVIPHGFTNDFLTEKNNASRNKDEILIGVFGNVIPNKRVDIIIRVMEKLVETNPEVRLRVIGHAEEDYKKSLIGLVNNLKVDKHIDFIDSPSIDVFKTYIRESDLCINLRWPTMGETSGTLMRALGYGVPCIVSNVGSYAEYPDESVWKVDVDEYEEELLLSYLLELCNNPKIRHQMSQNARKYINEQCDFKITALKYKEFMDSEE